MSYFLVQLVNELFFLYRYRSQYPILGLLYDDYEYIPPGSDTRTTVIEKTEDKWTCVSSLGHFSSI